MERECWYRGELAEPDEIFSFFGTCSLRQSSDIVEIYLLDTPSRHIVAVITRVRDRIVRLASILEFSLYTVEVIDPGNVRFLFCYDISGDAIGESTAYIGIDVIASGSYECKIQCTCHIVSLCGER